MTSRGARRGGVLHRLNSERHRLSFEEWVRRAEEEIAAERAKLEKARAELRATERRLDREWAAARTERDAIRAACKSMLDGLEGRLIVAEAVAKAAVEMALEVHSAANITQAKSAASNLHHVLSWARGQNGVVERAVEARSLSRAQRRLPTEGLRLRIAAFRHRIATAMHDRREQTYDPPPTFRSTALDVCHGRPACAVSPFAFCVVAETQSRLEADGFASEARLFSEIEELGRLRKTREA